MMDVRIDEHGCLTPAEIGREHAAIIAAGDATVSATPAALAEFLRCAIEADRAQRTPRGPITDDDVDAFLHGFNGRRLHPEDVRIRDGLAEFVAARDAS